MKTSVRTRKTVKPTCEQCRARKVRCDGQPNGCRNCERLKFECSFQYGRLNNADDSTRDLQIRLEKRRGPRACTECASQKIRCPGQDPTCANCVRRNRQCIYPIPKRPSRALEPTTPVESTAREHRVTATPPGIPDLLQGYSANDSVLPSSDVVMVMIEAYFEHLYPLPSFAVLHRRSVIRRYLEGSMEHCLILALCAVTAQHLKFQRFLPDVALKWAKRAEESLLLSLESPSVPKLQALILIIRYLIEARQFARAFMLAALAARFAAALRLNHDRFELHFLAQETRRRIMWSCSMLDGFFSVGLREYELCPADTLSIQLPCSEAAFQEGTPVKTPSLRGDPTNATEPLGLWGAFLRLLSIRKEIMKLTRKLESPGINSVELMHSVQLFEVQLQQLYDRFNEQDAYSPTMFSYSEEPVRLLMVHESWHQAYCDIYRIFLTGYREAAPSSTLVGISMHDIVARKGFCLQHALAIVQLLTEFSEQCAAKTLDFDTAICTYHSARIILFTARSIPQNQGLDRTDAMEKALFCQSILEKYFPTSPIVDPMKKELDILIARYSSEWKDTEAQRSQEGGDDLEINEATLAGYTRTRQQLSVHSLLRRADFEDTDTELTGRSLNVNVHDTQAIPTEDHLTGEIENGDFGIDIHDTGHIEPAAVDENVVIDPLYNGGGNLDQGQDNLHQVFNPWMGFSETLESYGITPSLDDDYF